MLAMSISARDPTRTWAIVVVHSTYRVPKICALVLKLPPASAGFRLLRDANESPIGFADSHPHVRRGDVGPPSTIPIEKKFVHDSWWAWIWQELDRPSSASSEFSQIFWAIAVFSLVCCPWRRRDSNTSVAHPGVVGLLCRLMHCFLQGIR